jgi:hypothetical protein
MRHCGNENIKCVFRDFFPCPMNCNNHYFLISHPKLVLNMVFYNFQEVSYGVIFGQFGGQFNLF